MSLRVRVQGTVAICLLVASCWWSPCAGSSPSSVATGEGRFRSGGRSPKKQHNGRFIHRKKKSRRRLKGVGTIKDGGQGGSTVAPYKLCKTGQPNKCGRLLLSNTYAIYREKLLRNATEPIDSKTINVHFHTFLPESEKKNGATLQQTTIDRFIRVLNRGFQGTNFQFAASDTTVTFNDKFHVCDKDRSMKAKTRIGSIRDLNVFLCDTRKQGYVGQSTFPHLAKRYKDHDGIVMMNPEIERNQTDIRNETIVTGLIHQVGHWLGLLHPFSGGGCDGEALDDPLAFEDNPSLAAQGDGVFDTPPQGIHHWNIRGRSKCWRNRRVSNGNLIDTCPRVGGQDDMNNFMSYIPWFCMNKYGHFSEGQELRMEAMWREYRRQGKRLRIRGVEPRRADIIETCLDQATRKCGCDLVCHQQHAEDTLELVLNDASVDTIDSIAGGGGGGGMMMRRHR